MRIEKTQIVNEIQVILKESSFVFFVDYLGLTVEEFSDLRGKLAEKNASCMVLKNSLVKKAAELAGIEALKGFELSGGTVFISGTEDASGVAKVIQEFYKGHADLNVKAGLLDGDFLSAAEVDAIASLPTIDVLRAQLLGVIEGVPRNLVTVLNAKVSEIVNVINAYKDKLEG